MAIKVKELENVTVEPSVEEGWDKWGSAFTQGFIGKTPNADHCKITNSKAIRFRYFKRSNRVIAYCDEPLIIENRALGYYIRYQLEQFELDFKNSTITYAGYPFFEEIKSSRRGLQQRWKQARQKAYFGSMMHFIRCLYRDSLSQSGYEILRMQRVRNAEKERVKKVYQAGIVIKDSGNKRMLSGTGILPDSMDYYRQVLKQKDEIDIYGKSLLTADSLLVAAGEYKTLFFADYLYVTYKKELEDKAYIANSGENRNPVFQRSHIWLVSSSPVSIDRNGQYYPPQELFSMSYWAWSEKTAELLPSDYLPGD